MTVLCNESGKNLDGNNFYGEVKNECKDYLQKKIKCGFCGKFSTKEWLSSHIERDYQPTGSKHKVVFNNNRWKNTFSAKEVCTSQHRSKNNKNANTIVSEYENYRHVLVGPSTVGKTS